VFVKLRPFAVCKYALQTFLAGKYLGNVLAARNRFQQFTLQHLGVVHADSESMISDKMDFFHHKISKH